MTATTRTTKPRVRQRPSVRLGAMEVLGFIDRPGTATTWTTTEIPRTPLPRPAPSGALAAEPPTIDEILETWVPSEVGQQLTKRRFRWGLMTTVLLLTTALVAAGFWIYRMPREAAAHALGDVEAAASALDARLPTVAALNAQLIASPTSEVSATQGLLDVDQEARALFDATGNLPNAEMTSRSLAADAAGDALDASRLVGDALAYRTAVIPLLVAPDLETDSSFIELDQAAMFFGEWRAEFDRVIAALPSGVLSQVTSELGLISAELDGIQSGYLDAVRRRDRWGAISALDVLSERLADAEVVLGEGLAAVHNRAADRLASAGESLALLLG